MTFLHVVIPAYGDSPYLYEAIESVVNSVDINKYRKPLNDFFQELSTCAMKKI